MIFCCVLTQIFFNPLSLILSNYLFELIIIWISYSRKWLEVSIDSNVQQSKVLFGYSWNIFAEAYSESCLLNISKMEFLSKIVIFLNPLTIFAKCSTLDVWQSSEYASDSIKNFILKYIPVIYITFLA